MFQTIFYQPIFNLIVFLYNSVPFNDLGLAIILLIIIIKLVFLPLSRKSIASRKALSDLQPKLDELKKKYADDKEALSRETMALYKNNKVNPFSSCLPLLIQFPFLIAIFRIFRDNISDHMDLLYPFVSQPQNINNISFGFIDLNAPNIYLAVLAGLAQFVQAKMMVTKQPEIKGEGSKDESMTAVMSKQMMYFTPIITIFIGIKLPGGLTFYWFMLTIFTILEQWLILRPHREKNIS
jgi:YidC/Oxa1 family membrane protein insertase